MCTQSCVIATDVAVPFNEVYIYIVQLNYSEVFRFGDLTRWLR